MGGRARRSPRRVGGVGITTVAADVRLPVSPGPFVQTHMADKGKELRDAAQDGNAARIRVLLDEGVDKNAASTVRPGAAEDDDVW